jgi:hypothetical protein
MANRSTLHLLLGRICSLFQFLFFYSHVTKSETTIRYLRVDADLSAKTIATADHLNLDFNWICMELY